LIPALLSLPMIGLFLAVAAPWFVWMQISYQRVLGLLFRLSSFPAFLADRLQQRAALLVLRPGAAARRACRGRRGFVRVCSWKYLVDPERGDMRSLMLVWMFGILVFFSLPNSKLVGYILPALPPLAFLIADALLGWLQQRTQAATDGAEQEQQRRESSARSIWAAACSLPAACASRSSRWWWSSIRLPREA
jgi:4-amino-4-deoxy-L-arabinose transferase-like glycosyltransferase